MRYKSTNKSTYQYANKPLLVQNFKPLFAVSPGIVMGLVRN